MKKYSNLEELLDKTGNKIEIGSYIVYGHALGRCAALKFGKVIDIEFQTDNFPQYPTHVRISVIGIDDEAHWSKPHLTKRGFLGFPERIIVLPVDKLPEYAKELLKNI